MIVGFTKKNGQKVSLDLAEHIAMREGYFDGYPYPIVMGIIRTQRYARDPGVHVTQLTGCLRQARYRQVEEEYPYISNLYWMFRGTLAHTIIEAIPEPGTIVEATFRREIDGIEIVGTPDKIIPARQEIQEWKTAKKVNVQSLPYGSHAKQVNIYRWLVEPQHPITKLSITYLDMARVATVEVPLEDDIEEYIRERVREFQNNMPPREVSYLCKGYCAFRGQCDKE